VDIVGIHSSVHIPRLWVQDTKQHGGYFIHFLAAQIDLNKAAGQWPMAIYLLHQAWFMNVMSIAALEFKYH
jgi:hypothetical protein